MSTREIERRSWDEYLASLSAMYVNHPVTMILESEALGSQVVAEHVPLVAIAPDPKGSEKGSVGVELGSATDTLRQEIPDVKRLMVRENEDGRPQAIDIEGEDPDSHARLKVIVTWD